jgi:hypothetical protein
MTKIFSSTTGVCTLSGRPASTTFDAQFLLYEFADQQKRKISETVTLLYIASLPQQNFPCIHLAEGTRLFDNRVLYCHFRID